MWTWIHRVAFISLALGFVINSTIITITVCSFVVMWSVDRERFILWAVSIGPSSLLFVCSVFVGISFCTCAGVFMRKKPPPLQHSVHTFTIHQSEHPNSTSEEPQLLSSTEPSSSVATTTTDINGVDSSDNCTVNFPFMAAILYENGFLLGTGAIVADCWIIVTSFQMGAFKPDVLRVRVGSCSPHSGGQLISVIQLFPHPMFSQFNNDVAMLKTADCMQLNTRVQPIPVAPLTPILGDSGALLTWDNTSAVQSQADVLPATDCKVFYPDLDLTESNICVVLDHILPYKVSLLGSPMVWNDSLVGLYMGMEASTFKPSLCSSLSPVINWVRRMIANETETVRLFPLD